MELIATCSKLAALEMTWRTQSLLFLRTRVSSGDAGRCAFVHAWRRIGDGQRAPTWARRAFARTGEDREPHQTNQGVRCAIHRLRHGIDELDYLLEHDAAITRFEERRRMIDGSS
jgi:hypothetical protein